MSEEAKKLVLLVVGALVLLVVVVVYVVGLINPFWCDVPIVNLVSCVTGKADVEKPQVSVGQPEFEATQEVERKETPVPVITTLPDEDLEQARSSDPVLEAFVQELKRALEQADFVVLEALLAEPLLIGPYASEYDEYSRSEAIEYLRGVIEAGKVTVDISNEGRRIAQEHIVTTLEGKFALLSFGWPDNVILGISKRGDSYFWTELVRNVP